MQRRVSLFQEGLDARNIDMAFLHTSDNVYYVSGVPLFSPWVHPMWACIHQNEKATMIGAMIEKEHIEKYSRMSDIRNYDDEKNVLQASIDLVVDFLKGNTAINGVIGIEHALIPADFDSQTLCY